MNTITPVYQNYPKSNLPFNKVNDGAIARAKSLLPAWLPGGSWQGVEWVTVNPKRKDSKAGSLSINSSNGKWKDFSSSEGGADLVSLYAWVHGTSQGEACQALAHDFGIKIEGKAQAKAAPAVLKYPRPILPVPEGMPALAHRPNEAGRWEYRDAEGRLLLVRVRTPDPVKEKAVITYTWCETGPGMAEWRPKAPEHPWPLYGLDRLAQRPEAPVLVVEGEKTAQAAEQVFPEMVAVTSGSADSAAGADWNALAARDVTIWPDADDAGQGCAVKVAGLLVGVAAAVRLVPLPEAINAWVKPGKAKAGGWDLADPVPAGVDLRAVLGAAKLMGGSAGEEMPYVHPTMPLTNLAAWIVGDVGRMLTEDPPPVRWLVPGVIPAGIEGILAARAGAGKSMTALEIAMALASGLGVLGRAVSQEEARGAIFAGLEDDEAEFHRRVRRGIALLEEDPEWTEAHRDNLARRLVPLFPNRASGASFRLEEQWQTIAQKAKAIPGGCGLIILDTLSRMADGDENSAKDMRPFNEAVSALAQTTGATVLSIHHLGKGNDGNSDKKLWERLHPEALRGSSAIEGAARFIIQMAALSPSEAQAAGLEAESALRGDYVAFHLSKISSAEKGSTVLLERRQSTEPGAGFLCLHPDSERVLAVIQGQAAVMKLTKRDSVLLAIAEAGGLGRMDQKAAAARIWPDSGNPKGQWDKMMSALRKDCLLRDPALTDAGLAKAETLGYSPSNRKAANGSILAGTPETQGLPPGRGETEETEGRIEGIPSFHSEPLGQRNGRKDSGTDEQDFQPCQRSVAGDGFTVDL
jgi:hypothetical protein